MISLIAVMATNRVIGKDNSMPWHHRADLRHFKTVTMGKPVVMGRRTYESIGKPLPGRTNIVVSRDKSWQMDGVLMAYDLDSAMAQAGDHGEEIMIIGGAALYQAFLDKADKMYLTIIDHDYAGDTYFPAFDLMQWSEVSRRDFPSDPEHPYPYSFVTLVRNR